MRCCRHCGEDRQIETLGAGVIRCDVCSKLTHPGDPPYVPPPDDVPPSKPTRE